MNSVRCIFVFFLVVCSPVRAQEPVCSVLRLGVAELSAPSRNRVWKVYIQSERRQSVSVRVHPGKLRWRLQSVVGGTWKDVGTWGIGPGTAEVTAAPRPMAEPFRTIRAHGRLSIGEFDLRLIPVEDLKIGEEYRFILEQDVELKWGSGARICALVSKPEQFSYVPSTE